MFSIGLARTSEFQEERQLLHSDSLVIINERIFGQHGFKDWDKDSFETYVIYPLRASLCTVKPTISGRVLDNWVNLPIASIVRRRRGIANCELFYGLD